MDLLKKNVGKVDRIFRVVFGAGFLFGGWSYVAAPLSYLLLLVGLILLVTGLVGACPAYSVIGITTKGKRYCDF